MKRLFTTLVMIGMFLTAAPAGRAEQSAPQAPSTGVTYQVSVSSSEEPGNGASMIASITPGGRFVVFESNAPNLIPGDDYDFEVFVRDLAEGITILASLPMVEPPASEHAFDATISADGRFVAFEHQTVIPVGGGAELFYAVFVHDRLTGLTERVSVSSSGEAANDASYDPSISADGRFVAFASDATNLVSDVHTSWMDLYVHDRLTGMTEVVSRSSQGEAANDVSYLPLLSADGRFVAFESYATNLVSRDQNGTLDVFVRDRLSGLTQRVSESSSDVQANGYSGVNMISADGRFVSFSSSATNLVSDDTNQTGDVFVYDRLTDLTERVSLSSSGEQANESAGGGAISSDGRFVVFISGATNLVDDDTSHVDDVFVHDRLYDLTERVSLSSSGEQANGHCYDPTISADGRFVAFHSFASNLSIGDINDNQDVFVRERWGPPLLYYFPLILKTHDYPQDMRTGQ